MQAMKHYLLHLLHHLSILCFFICCGAVPGTQPGDWLQLRNPLQAAPTAVLLPCCLQLCDPLTGDQSIPMRCSRDYKLYLMQHFLSSRGCRLLQGLLPHRLL